MQLVMSQYIKDAQEDQARGSDESKHHTQGTEHLLRPCSILCQATAVPQPTFGEERGIEEDGCNAGPCDKEWFE